MRKERESAVCILKKEVKTDEVPSEGVNLMKAYWKHENYFFIFSHCSILIPFLPISLSQCIFR